MNFQLIKTKFKVLLLGIFPNRASPGVTLPTQHYIYVSISSLSRVWGVPMCVFAYSSGYGCMCVGSIAQVCVSSMFGIKNHFQSLLYLNH